MPNPKTVASYFPVAGRRARRILETVGFFGARGCSPEELIDAITVGLAEFAAVTDSDLARFSDQADFVRDGLLKRGLHEPEPEVLRVELEDLFTQSERMLAFLDEKRVALGTEPAKVSTP